MHGPATGPLSIVDTDGGPVRTAARAIDDMLSSLAALADGTEAAPSLAFLNDANTGIYLVGADQFGISAGGAMVAGFGTAGIEMAAGMRVRNVTDPTDAQDVATKAYTDAAVATGGSGLPTRWIKAATGGETSLSGLDDSATGLSYIPGAEEVYINGVRLVRALDYAATTGSTITGLTALVAGDIVEVYCFTVGPPIDDTLTALAAYNTNGILTQTAADTFVGRTIAGTTNEVSVTNGDGVSGNPTVSLPSAITLTGKTMTGGTFASPAAITGLPDPTNAQDAATKAYVDGMAAGLDTKGSVRCATTTDITRSGEQTIDGIAAVTGDRVLVKNQSASAENGIFVVAAGAWARASDMDAWTEVPGAFCFVEEGSTNADRGYVCTSDAGGTLDTTSIVWTQFNGGGGGGITEVTADVMATAVPAFGMDQPINLGLSLSVAAGALTIALKGADGNDPSASNPVLIAFRSATLTTAQPLIRKVEGALSLVVSSGSTLGATSATPFRLWIVAFDDAGTIRLGVINAADATRIYPLRRVGVGSSTAEGGAGAADAAGTIYTGTAVTAKAYRVLGCATWESGLTTAGTWDAAPTDASLCSRDTPMPGDVIQAMSITQAAGSGTTSASMVDVTGATLSITPTSAAHRVRFSADANVTISAGGAGANSNYIGQLLRSATVIGSYNTGVVSGAGTNIQSQGHASSKGLDAPNTSSAVTYKMQHRSSTTGTATATTAGINMLLEEIAV